MAKLGGKPKEEEAMTSCLVNTGAINIDTTQDFHKSKMKVTILEKPPELVIPVTKSVNISLFITEIYFIGLTNNREN